MENTSLNPVPITHETIGDFLNYLREKKRSEATIRKYGADVKKFFGFLPEDKMLTADSLLKWREYLIGSRFAARTVNTRIAACNSFLGYLDRSSWQVSPVALVSEASCSALCREEYYALLKAARQSDKEWLYYLIKTFCCFGLSTSELHFMTVDALVSGSITITSKSRIRHIYVPEILKNEFLTYALKAQVNSGSFFKSPLGKPLTRSLIVKELSELCKAAGIPTAKGYPKTLRELYFNTYSDIRSASSALVNKEYAKILEEEDRIVGWDNIAV